MHLLFSYSFHHGTVYIVIQNGKSWLREINIAPKISLQRAVRLRLKPRIITFQRVTFNSSYYVLANTSEVNVPNLPSLRHLLVIL